ncbi:polyphosphatase DDP1 [Gigaspora margarita]|uniref:Polyphosphatase DDP1 n=2 Tax=Gigaspora margarita TaxID=4874 RepID=A0A8H3X0I1_GIGMA|nr:polyphosphatase DDP1 [Gigaspora margarita]
MIDIFYNFYKSFLMTDTLNIMEARTGREKQVYKKGSIRQVAGCVPVNKTTKKILLITPRREKKGGWMLPKGGWENDESEQEAAIRETYEEAGARGKVTSLIGVWDHKDINKKTGLPKATFSFFEMEVEKLEDKWPEMDERDRQWFAYDDALKALIKPFMREVVEQCSLAPSNKKSKKEFSESNIIKNHKDTWNLKFSVIIVFFTFLTGIWYLIIKDNKLYLF